MTAMPATPPPIAELDLFEAAQRNDVARVTHLLAHGLQAATEFDREHCTALHWAAMNNHWDVLLLLLAHGAVVDARGGDLHATPLHWATR
jgi:ankyrin repeat protein